LWEFLAWIFGNSLTSEFDELLFACFFDREFVFAVWYFGGEEGECNMFNGVPGGDPFANDKGDGSDICAGDEIGGDGRPTLLTICWVVHCPFIIELELVVTTEFPSIDVFMLI
jgi:hypothetical protein